MNRISLYFESPSQISIRQESIPGVQPHQVLIKSHLSAISHGTESLIYLGQFPDDIELDENIQSISGKLNYPLKYGYAVVGEVIECGKDIDRSLEGKRVFVFHPHESLFTADQNELIQVPDSLTDEDAVFLANMETAVNLVMDGKPVLGENVVVFGQGVVGLLTTAILSFFPLENLIILDRYELRREASKAVGAHICYDPADPGLKNNFKQRMTNGADLVYEISGSPDALNHAIEITGYGGRIVIGSFYGKKNASLDLGGWFHRSRMRLISSQVSTIAPEFSSRWSKARRFDIAWDMLNKIKPSRLITDRLPLEHADSVYRLLVEHPEKIIQAVFTY